MKTTRKLLNFFSCQNMNKPVILFGVSMLLVIINHWLIINFFESFVSNLPGLGLVVAYMMAELCIEDPHVMAGPSNPITPSTDTRLPAKGRTSLMNPSSNNGPPSYNLYDNDPSNPNFNERDRQYNRFLRGAELEI